MDWKIEFAVKDCVRNWSNQNIITKYESVNIEISIIDLTCKLHLYGEEVERVYYLVWELLFLYDGYFYEPKIFYENDSERDPKVLFRVPFYHTDKEWYSSALLGRNSRNLSEDVIKKYEAFRNQDKSVQKMTKAVVNAFYYLHSESYSQINSNHRLSLLLNVCDGFINNTFKETNNVKASLDRLFKGNVDKDKVRKGISLLGMPDDQFTYNLAEERNEFDHYIYKADSIASFIANATDRRSNFVTWYFIYTIELVLRIGFLKQIGINITQEVKDYAMDVIIDWVIYENDLPEDCATFGYQMKQLEKRLSRENIFLKN